MGVKYCPMLLVAKVINSNSARDTQCIGEVCGFFNPDKGACGVSLGGTNGNKKENG